jgi:hypothetical protein
MSMLGSYCHAVLLRVMTGMLAISLVACVVRLRRLLLLLVLMRL